MSAARRAALALSPQLRRLITERDELRADADKWKKRLARSQAHLAALEQENSRLRAVSSGAGSDLRYLFVVAYGRSGSTLLQGILNSIPGYTIRGENGGSTYRLYQYRETMVSRQAKHVRKKPLGSNNPWYGIDHFRTDTSDPRLRQIILDTCLRPEADTKVSGFKEIRWWWADWEKYFDFLDELFPGARFVINTRQHSSVSQSKWWADKEPEKALEQLRRYETQLDRVAERYGDRAYRIHYNDYIADRNVLKGMFDWLGEDFDRTKIDEVMDIPHATSSVPEL